MSGYSLLGRLQGLGQVPLHRLVVAAVHEQQVAGGGVLRGPGQPGVPVGPGQRRVRGDLLAVVVPSGKEQGPGAGSRRDSPTRTRCGGAGGRRIGAAVRRQGDAPAKGRRRHARLTQELGHLPHVSEGVGLVADPAGPAQILRRFQAPVQVANVGLAAGEILVLQHIPRPAFSRPLRTYFSTSSRFSGRISR